MKKTLLALFLICTATISFAGNDKYVKAMETALTVIDTANSISSYQKAANRFERIANAEKEEWLPYYWESFCYVMMSYLEKESNKKDDILDKAQESIDKAEPLVNKEAEIYIMKAWILSARIDVNPTIRGRKFGRDASTMREKAKELNPENPRYYYLKGTSLFYTPPMFGGGKDKAMPILETAMEKYNSFKPESSIYPDWGKEQAKKMLEQCREK